MTRDSAEALPVQAAQATSVTGVLEESSVALLMGETIHGRLQDIRLWSQCGGGSMTRTVAFDNEPLTANGGQSGRCANPLCRKEMPARKLKKVCSDPCRMDVYVLRRAREMRDRVGIVKFNSIMDEV